MLLLNILKRKKARLKALKAEIEEEIAAAERAELQDMAFNEMADMGSREEREAYWKTWLSTNSKDNV